MYPINRVCQTTGEQLPAWKRNVLELRAKSKSPDFLRRRKTVLRRMFELDSIDSLIPTFRTASNTMFRTILIWHLHQMWRSAQLRATVLGAVLVVTFVSIAAVDVGPAELVERLTWAQFLTAVVCGGFLTAWRVTQLPKSRSYEFYLLAPSSDWELLAGEVLAGMLRTTVVVLATAPLLVALWGAEWISGAGCLALLTVPLVAGWLSGLAMAVVAFEPLWFRRLVERLVLLVVLVYLVVFGLLGHFCMPTIVALWSKLTGTPVATFAQVGATTRYLNPFRLLGAVSSETEPGLLLRLAVVTAALVFVSALCFARLVMRLRKHYQEENYFRPGERRKGSQRIGMNPLSWWTRRRVSQFRGNVNLYLTWTTLGLYSCWMMLEAHWPSWLAINQLLLIRTLGGEALLLVAALQLAVVPMAFLNGLWDSNSQQRVRRLELLLITPLAGREFLWASAMAAWTRGKGYLLGALGILMASLIAGRITGLEAIGILGLGASYLLLCFAVAFRNFARVESDQSVTVRGMVWSIGMPLLTFALFRVGNDMLAAATPLGAVFIMALPTAERAAWIDGSMTTVWTISGVIMAGCLIGACLLLRSALRNFEREIHTWFEANLVRGAEGEPSDNRRRRVVPRFLMPVPSK